MYIQYLNYSDTEEGSKELNLPQIKDKKVFITFTPCVFVEIYVYANIYYFIVPSTKLKEIERLKW